MSSKKDKDALIGRRVRINETAQPWPGREGTAVRAHKDRGYEIDFGGEGSTYWFAMAEFTVLAHEGGGTPGSHLVEADPYLAAFSLTNPRKRKGLGIDSLNALAANIKAIGLGQPITVRPLPGTRTPDTFLDRGTGQPLPIYELVCGERRLRACRIAGLQTMPMLVRALSDEQALELQLVENIEREDLDDIEEAEGFEQLRQKCGYTVDQIADHIAQGKGPSYVRKAMKLLALTEDSRQALYDGHLGRSTGLLVARYPAAQQAEVVKFIKSQARDGEPAAYRTVAPLVHQRFNLVLSAAVWDIADDTLVAAAGACGTCPKRTGAQADIFGDVDVAEDSCTDPDCFADKRAAHSEQVRAQAKKDGLQVIDGDEAKEAVFSPHASWMRGYRPVTDTAWTETGNDGVEREVTFDDALRKMGKKAPKPQLLIHPYTGAGIKVVNDVLQEQLEQLNPDLKAAAKNAQAINSGDNDDDQDDGTPESALNDYDVLRAVLLRMFAAIRARERTADELRLAVKTLLVDQDGTELMEDYLGWPSPDDSDDYDTFKQEQMARIDAMPPEQLGQVLAMAVAEISMGGRGSGGRRAEQVALAQSYGIDILAVRDKVAEDLERQEQSTEKDEEAEPA